MKNRITIACALAFSTNIVCAGEITDSYNPGDTLTATMMDNIKTAVNDNNTNKQNRVTGSCIAGQSIRVINANGTVTCEVDTDTNTTYTAGSGIAITGTSISARIGADITVNPTLTNIPQGSTTITPVINVSVTAPSSGYILVTHSGFAVLFGEPNEIKIGIGSASNAFNTSVDVGNLDASSSQRVEYAYSTQYLYTVAAGTHTYYGLAQKNTTFNAGSVNVVPKALSAIFIPNRY